MGNTPPHNRRENSYEEYGRLAHGSPGSGQKVRLEGKRRRAPAAASAQQGEAAARRNVDEDEHKPVFEGDASDEHDPVVETAGDQLTRRMSTILSSLTPPTPPPEENASDEHMALVESTSTQLTDDTSFLHACRRMAPLGDGDLALRVASQAEHFYRMAGRRDVGVGDVNTLAWLSLAAAFLGEDRAFIAKLHGGSPEHRAALQRACMLGMNFIGGSSVSVCFLKKNASPFNRRHHQIDSPSIPHRHASSPQQVPFL